MIIDSKSQPQRFLYTKNPHKHPQPQKSLANLYGASLSTTLLKLIETNAYTLFVVCSEDNEIILHWRTPDFPYNMFKDHYLGVLPALTVAADYFNHGTKCEDAKL